MEKIYSVWILSSLYENGKYEVNGVFESKESAEHLKEFMEIHSKDAQDGYQIKENKIEEFIIMQ